MSEMTRSLILLVSTLIIGCTGVPEGLEPVSEFEVNKYLGKWYEIARLDHSFEKDLSNASAVYSRDNTGNISVTNKGYNVKTGKWKQIEGRARFIGDETVGSLKVSFFGPFYGGYHVIALDKETYRYAMVAGPNRSYLWILSRDRTPDASVYSKLVSKADAWGFDAKNLILVAQNLPEE